MSFGVKIRTLDYLDPFQSEFSFGYGTETALVTLMYNLWWKQDQCAVYILALLDLIAAFNAINHGILLGQLWEFGMYGTLVC